MSVQSILTNLFLRWQFKPKPGEKLNVSRVRAGMKKRAALNARPPQDITRTPIAPHAERGLCAAEWLSPQQSQYTVLYFHGGGYFFCGLDTHRPIASYLARTAKAKVLSVDYRLAPEHPFPAAVDDALAWYRELLRQGVDPENLVVAGDSAGGGLSLACLLAARDQGLPMPAGALLYSPWVDLACAGETYKTLARADVMFQPDALPQAAALYLNGHSPKDPLASPLYADLRGLPPLQIFASRHEILLADAMRLHDRAREDGVVSRLTLRSRLPHVWPTMVMLPEARASLRESAAFIHEVCNGVPSQTKLNLRAA